MTPDAISLILKQFAQPVTVERPGAYNPATGRADPAKISKVNAVEITRYSDKDSARKRWLISAEIQDIEHGDILVTEGGRRFTLGDPTAIKFKNMTLAYEATSGV